MAHASAPQAGPLKINWIKVGGTVLAVIVFFIIRYADLGGMSEMAKGTLALLGGCVVLWIFQPFTMTWVSVFGMALGVILGYSTFATAVSGFAGSTFFLLFAAMGIGAAINQSGLGKRIALILLKAVGRPTFKRVLLAVFLVLFAFEFMIPSVLAKSVAILAVFLPVVSMFGLGLDSKIAKAINLSVFLGAYAGSIVLPTGGVNTVIVYGVMQQLNIPVNFMEWAVLGTPLAIVILAAFYFFMTWWIKPEVEEVQGGSEAIAAQLKALPPMSIKEIWCAIVTVTVLILWLMDSTLKIGTHNVGLIAVCLYSLPVIGSYTFAELCSKYEPWDTLVLVGAILGVSAMPTAAGAGPFLGELVAPVTGMATSPIGMMISNLIINLVQWPLMLAIPIIPFVIKPLADIAATWGASPNVAGIYYLVFFPQFAYWAFALFYQIAAKDGAVSLKDWLIASGALFVITVLAVLIWSYLWVPVVVNMHLAG